MYNNDDDIVYWLVDLVLVGVLSPRRSLLDDLLNQEEQSMSIDELIEEMKRQVDDNDDNNDNDDNDDEEHGANGRNETIQRIHMAKTYGYAVKFDDENDDDNNDKNDDNDNNDNDNDNNDSCKKLEEEDGEIQEWLCMQLFHLEILIL